MRKWRYSSTILDLALDGTDIVQEYNFELKFSNNTHNKFLKNSVMETASDK
jgi:hypothetical protein